MIRPRWMKVIRDIWGNKTRTMLVVASIAVGIFAIGTISGTQELLAREMTGSFMAINPAHATIYTEPFDDDLLEVVRSMEGVRAAEGRRVVTVRARVGDDWKNLDLNVIPENRQREIGKIRPVSGAFPPRRGEVLIERAALNFLGAKTGQPLVVETSDQKERELTVSGVVHDIDQFPTPLAGRGYGYITAETLERLGAERYYNQLQILIEGDSSDVTKVEPIAKQVAGKVEKSGRTVWFTHVPKPGKHPADDAIMTFMLVLGVLGLISLLASGFLVINTVGAILAQNTRQIGMMKAVGARTGQIVGLYLGLVMSYALLSLLVGIPLGAMGAYGFSVFLAGLINFDIVDPSVPRSVLILEVSVGLLVPLLAAIFPIIAGARVTVREAVSDHGVGTAPRRGRFDRLLERIRFLSRPILLSLRNTFRRKGRLVLTLITLTLGGAIFIGVFSVRSSLMLTIDDALRYWNYDLDINMTRPYRIEEMVQVALQVPGVTQVEGWAFGSARRKQADGEPGETLTIVSPPAETELLRPQLLEGRWLLPEDENALVINTEVLKEEADIKVGDEIVLTINEKESTWKVVGLVRGVMTGRIMYANYPYYSNLVRSPGRASGIRVVTQQHDGPYQKKVGEELKEALEGAGFRVGQVETMFNIRNQVQVQFDLLVAFMAVMAFLLATVGGLGLAGTMSMNVLERTREIGVMRAIGASTWAMLKIFMVEGIMITMISVMLGTLVALPISKLLSDAVGMAFLKAPLSYTFSYLGLILWLIMATLIALVSSFLPSWRATRLTVRDVLAYE